ncbi:MAG TPA: hypothetical protein VJC39_03555 [Candidatus Nanoarchaeia archaeon]|nr:hypothetical protein [Candidatus Nanoarchaeia archaeon]
MVKILKVLGSMIMGTYLSLADWEATAVSDGNNLPALACDTDPEITELLEEQFEIMAPIYGPAQADVRTVYCAAANSNLSNLSREIEYMQNLRADLMDPIMIILYQRQAQFHEERYLFGRIFFPHTKLAVIKQNQGDLEAAARQWEEEKDIRESIEENRDLAVYFLHKAKQLRTRYQ